MRQRLKLVVEIEVELADADEYHDELLDEEMVERGGVTWADVARWEREQISVSHSLGAELEARVHVAPGQGWLSQPLDPSAEDASP